ncbi:hypothetical protein GCM10009836_65640 [Pseudonocardia ailaonensis]|uniref:ARB-07466-like C-terminal domain-containing protein n=1 Tax=Pseudonocardia ailaonensis TaxID=367279 RepID=A0ABN2NM51_9PSEU
MTARLPDGPGSDDPPGSTAPRIREPAVRPGRAPERLIVSRHRSPTPGVAAVRRGLAAAAAAVTGGALAVAAPTVTMLAGGLAPEPGEARVGLAGSARTPEAAAKEEPPLRGATLAAMALPVRYDDSVDPARSLLKSAALNDAAHTAEEARKAAEARLNCPADLSALGAVKSWVRDAARFLSCQFDEPDLIGVAGRGRVSDHPRGLALDLMARGAKGDEIAACALRNQKALGISYVIWEQRINYGSGWQRMEDRGSATENHVDHVHLSFTSRQGSGTPTPCG